MAHGPGLLSTLWLAVRLCFRRPDCLILWPLLLFFILVLSAVLSLGVFRTLFPCLATALLLVPPAYSVFVAHVFASKSSYGAAMSVVLARAGPIAVIAAVGPVAVFVSLLFTGMAWFAAFYVGPAPALAFGSTCLLGMLYLWGRVVILPSVIALEDEPDLDAVRRAWNMTGRHHLHTLVLGVIVFGPMIAGCVALLMIMLAMLANCGGDPCLGGRGAAVAGTVVLVALLYVPVALALQTSFYLGLREEERIIEGSLLPPCA